MIIYYFIYKITHKNGKFYIGRHQTTNLNDNYYGSGKWVKSFKNKQNLKKEILEFTNSIENLYILEEQYINTYWGNPLCMNIVKGSNGWNSEDAKNIQHNRIKNNSHNFLNSEWQKKYIRIRIKNKTHVLMKRKDGTSISSDRVKNGTHHFLGGEIQKRTNISRVKNGTHHFLGQNANKKRIDEGTHNFLGSSSNEKMLSEGKHPSQIQISCVFCKKQINYSNFYRWHGNKCKKCGENSPHFKSGNNYQSIGCPN